MSQVLAIDTATSVAVAGLGDGSVLNASSSHRHGAHLLALLDELLGPDPMQSLAQVTAVVVGTGPGSFTGLRVGMAVAKTIAYSRDLPIVGVPTAVSLARAAFDAEPELRQLAASVPFAVLQPAGPNDRYLTFVQVNPDHGGANLVEPSRVLSPGESIDSAVRNAVPLAVDLETDERFGLDARARGERALAGLGSALIRIGAVREGTGRVDDVASLVPAYVTLPRGVRDAAQEIAWSPALR